MISYLIVFISFIKYQVGKPLFRKTKDGRIFEWKVEKDDHLCTLEEVFQKINHSKGFNIEFKFDDNIVYKEDELVHAIEVVLHVCSCPLLFLISFSFIRIVTIFINLLILVPHYFRLYINMLKTDPSFFQAFSLMQLFWSGNFKALIL